MISRSCTDDCGSFSLRARGFKAWKQLVSHIDPSTGARQICSVLEGDTSSEHEGARINKAEDTAKREDHNAGMGTRSGRGRGKVRQQD